MSGQAPAGEPRGLDVEDLGSARVELRLVVGNERVSRIDAL